MYPLLLDVSNMSPPISSHKQQEQKKINCIVYNCNLRFFLQVPQPSVVHMSMIISINHSFLLRQERSQLLKTELP